MNLCQSSISTSTVKVFSLQFQPPQRNAAFSPEKPAPTFEPAPAFEPFEPTRNAAMAEPAAEPEVDTQIQVENFFYYKISAKI